MKKDIHNIFRTTLKLGVILLFVITIFSSTSGVIIDEDLIIEINNETYTFLEEMNFERIVISTEFIILNNTGFNITSTNPSEIQINNIANNTLYPDTVDENLVDFTLLNADAGDIWFNISGFYPETYYEVTTDGVLLEYYQANDTGSVSIFVEGADSKQYNINANATAFNPIVTTTGTATNITNNGAILYANLVYDGGESCDVWIEYGTTESYGIDSTYNATKTTGGEFLYDFNWDLQNPSPLIDLNNVGHDDDDFFQRFECFGNINITYINYSLAKDNDGASYNIEAFVIDSPLGSTSYSETTVSMDDVPESPDTLWFNFKFDPAIQLIDIHEDSNIYGFGVSDDASPFNHLRILSSSNDNYEYGAYYYTDIGDFDYDICFIVNNGTSYRRNLSAGQLYHYRAVAKNTNSTSYGADAAFLTLPNVTRNPVATPRSDTMNLTWINGSGANNTYIERNKTGITSWERGEGTLIYNESGFAFTDLSLELETTYHYQFWSFTNWTDGGTIYNNFSPIYNTTSSTTHIIYPPYNGASSYDTTNLKVNLTWTSGNNSDYDIVIQNNNSYSNSPTDGWVRQNNTSNSSNYFNTTIITNAYFTIWSYNESSDCYSSTGLNIPWGAIALSCYSENNPETALTFDIEISNSSFTVTYAANDLTNPHYLDMEDIPYGVGTIFQVSSDGYETRSFTYDILQNAFYNLTFYLPLSIPSGGTSDPDYDENETYSEDYVIHVVGPQSEYGVDPPIEDAEVIIRKYINTTGQYQTVGVYVTSADGTFTVPLLPNQFYSFNVSADGYYDEVESWMPVEIVFEGDRHHTFRLSPLSGGDISGGYDIFWDTITFTADMNDIDGVNGTITIIYNDENLSTTNTQIYIYEFWEREETLIDTISNTSTNTISYTTDVINTTRTYIIVLFYNNTANFDVSSPITLVVHPINIWSSRIPFDIDERTTNVFGPFSLGYANLIAAGLAILALVMFGPHNTGIGIMASGFTLALTSFLFSVLFTSGSFNALLTILTPVVVIIGGLYMLVKDPGGHL